MLKRSVLLLGLIWLNPAHALIATVGPGGAFATIQDAINAVLENPGDDVIRVGSGTYFENLSIRPFGSGNTIDISGGWDNTFSIQSATPSIVDGGSVGSVAFIELENGDGLVFNNITFQNGMADSGGGLNIFQAGNSTMTISDSQIINNIAADVRTTGGGLEVQTGDTSTFSILNSQISDNQTICSGATDCRAGGITLTATGSAQVVFSGTSMVNNSVTIASGSAFTGGALIDICENCGLIFDDNNFASNSINGTTSNGGGVAIDFSGAGAITARRNRVVGSVANIPVPGSVAQWAYSKRGDAPSTLSDNLITDSTTIGLRASITGDGSPTLYLVNLTVANHAGIGVQLTKFSAGGEISLSNSISVLASPNNLFGDGVTGSDNLVAGPAGFVDPAMGNYDLALDSPAKNAGNNTPPGGLGPTDFAGNPRVFGGTVDQGAYEVQSLGFFEDGFEAP